MGRSSFTFAVVSLLAAACGASVDVGGPRADGGSSGSSASKGGSVSTTPGGGSESMPSGGSTATAGTTSMPMTPEKVASMPARCTTDADCCLVTDSCLNAAYVVGKDSREQVRALIDGRDKTRCTGCIAPIVAVSCQNSVCVGVEVPYDSQPDPILEMDHCGAAASNDAEMAMGGASGAFPPSPSGGADASDPSTNASPPKTTFGCGIIQ